MDNAWSIRPTYRRYVRIRGRACVGPAGERGGPAHADQGGALGDQEGSSRRRGIRFGARSDGSAARWASCAVPSTHDTRPAAPDPSDEGIYGTLVSVAAGAPHHRNGIKTL